MKDFTIIRSLAEYLHRNFPQCSFRMCGQVAAAISMNESLADMIAEINRAIGWGE